MRPCISIHYQCWWLEGRNNPPASSTVKETVEAADVALISVHAAHTALVVIHVGGVAANGRVIVASIPLEPGGLANIEAGLRVTTAAAA